MNCKHVKELLPLYVGRDLDEKRVRLITAHMESCVECTGSAAEFREARQLVQQFAPPPFSDAVYTGIRQRVLREIGRESTAPALSKLFAGLFSPRVIWTGSTAMALAVLVFAFYFIANRANDQRDGQRAEKAAANVVSPGQKLTAPSIQQSGGQPPAIAGQTSGPGKTPPELEASNTLSHKPKMTGVSNNRVRRPAVKNPDAQSRTARALPAVNNPAESVATPPRDATTAEKPLRVEIQTSDRNIRIIWFTSKSTKQDSPGKFSKGT